METFSRNPIPQSFLDELASTPPVGAAPSLAPCSRVRRVRLNLREPEVRSRARERSAAPRRPRKELVDPQLGAGLPPEGGAKVQRPRLLGRRKCTAGSGAIRGRRHREPHDPSPEGRGAAMSASGVAVSAAGAANEAPEVPDNVGDWLRGVYRFATDRNDFRRNLILNLGLFAAGVWLARNLSDIDLMAPQPGV